MIRDYYIFAIIVKMESLFYTAVSMVFAICRYLWWSDARCALYQQFGFL